ncbi:hypothetical protein QO034_19525 [Sedimentitalea sp. JM2-8]|uniref:Uncharacterized protein n=1 Tax=Sedimentitalea xiamensis TaxID=3050037 RepID=A0ABT7FJI6_9RHOB|nr:hypothetical protein [Sedimentitalea xiamensis]MDK3075276.1 hypothetical protein [Sedimentitalea xiamensis]
MAAKLTDQQLRFIAEYLGVRLKAEDQDAKGGGLVEKRAFLVTRWQSISAELDTELDMLCSAIAENVPFEKPDDIRRGVSAAIRPILDEMLDQIQDAVDKSINAGDLKYSAVKGAISSARNQCSSSELIAALRDNTLSSGQRFENAITDALTEIEVKLTA